MTYEMMMQDNDYIDMLVVKWKPMLDFSSDTVHPISDVIVRIQTAIMFENVERVYTKSRDRKREVPKIRREFPLMSESERINMINDIAVQNICNICGFTVKQAKLYLGV